MKVLIGCEESGVVREEFRALGHEAWSCDIKPASDRSKHHLEGDVRHAAYADVWDLFICHPPCTFLSSSGMHWTTRGVRDPKLTEYAIDFVKDLWAVPIPRKGFENPVGVLSTRWMKPTQIIQPYEFGEDASKRTCLWLDGLPPLVPTQYVKPRQVFVPGPVDGPLGKWLPRWSNQTDSGQNRLGPSEERAALRSRTYRGIARAMAEQWGAL